ncbi:hypothetical protein [Candidatus Thiodiazotropha endoloripes]|uniref:Sel1 repeat family protein n=1 Tax=Candidatus Thiodiazotropha endoloripes TaxID=1818881 RepID=A0A1E2URA6_9GAMM|nr:hypothetical protein [Candidatus Thiodiazotropha endoloripes]MCG7985220.1 hypothetical protein [Candidatus Thiodiazotropha lotti]ODB97276.1 hypothetical protein A3196_11210 [Candidatus Thiodiazotropha endoloripes]
MKWFKYILRRFAYNASRIYLTVICLPTKFGRGEDVCREFTASHDYGAGTGAYMRGNYLKCYEILSPYQELEDDYVYGGIKYQLALLFYYGHGVTLNRGMANKLFEESAALGWDDAQKYLSQFNGAHRTRT